MPHPRWLARTGFALGALVAGGFVGCLSASQDGDPGPAFASGNGKYPPSGYGYAGASGSGYAGATGPGTGAAGAAGGKDGGATDGGATDGASDAPSDTGALGDAGTGSKAAACTVGATATFSVAWSLEDATGADSTCDGTGGKTVDVDVVNLKTGAEALSTVPCAALAATTCAMPAGDYSISLKLRDAGGDVLSEVFAPSLTLVDGQATGVASVPLQVGGPDAAKGRGFALTWSIDKVGTGAIESCAQAGAMTVRLLAGTTKFDLTCADGKGRTTAIAPGSYPVTLDLLTAAGAKLSETQTMTVTIGAGQLVFLGDVPFDVN
jgi:hypothetical protein